MGAFWVILALPILLVKLLMGVLLGLMVRHPALLMLVIMFAVYSLLMTVVILCPGL